MTEGRTLASDSKIEPREEQWKEFDDILAQIDALRRDLRKISGQSLTVSGTVRTPEAELNAVRIAAANLVAKRIVPLSSQVLNVPALTIFRKMLATVLQSSRPTFCRFVNGFGFIFRPPLDDAQKDDPTLGRTLIGTFAKATFPRSITWAHGDAVDVQVEPDPENKPSETSE